MGRNILELGIEGCFFVKYLGLVNAADKIEEEKTVDPL